MYKKFGVSGGFKKKQKRLMKNIVQKYPLSSNSRGENIALPDHNETLFEQSDNEPIACDHENLQQISNISDMNPQKEIPNSPHAEEVIEVDIEESKQDRKIRDFPFEKTKFQSALASWSVSNGIKHDQLRGLLKIWNEHVPLPVLPVDPRTLLQTPRNVGIKENKYWYRGLKIALQKMLETTATPPDDLSLKFNVDGISVSKSSAMECWPILIEIDELSQIPPEIIGVYCGEGKPKNLESYLREFVDEFNDLLSNGLFHNQRNFKVKLKCFVADSPARALLKSRLLIIKTNLMR